MQRQVLEWSRGAKRMVVVGLDVLLAIIATWVAFTLRLDALHRPETSQWWVYGLAPALAVPVFVKMGLYRAIFRYTGQAAMLATAKAVAIYALLLIGLLLWQKWPGVPRTLGVLQPLIFLILVAFSRASARFWLANLNGGREPEGRMLVYGAGTSGIQTATAMTISGQYTVVGFVDDDPAMSGRSINGMTVYPVSGIPKLVERSGVTDILLALPEASRAQRNLIIERLQSLPVHIRTLPDWADLASGRISIQDVHELDVEDLLGRAPVEPDEHLVSRHLTDRVVLVSGAGGSIGGELSRQILLQKPHQLLLLDHNEFGLYSIHQELESIRSSRQLNVELIALLGSVANPRRLRAICETYRPSTIYHAAAYKHVPMVENNAAEGVNNNIVGTLNLALVAQATGVSRFVLISTDKAVRPTNVMGATKRMAEQILQALAANDKSSQTCFTMVRFGNVLGSSGSVVPLFRKQLAAGGPLTVTHPEVTRYFMTIPEAAQLVLQAGAMAQGGEVFLLNMGEPVRIIDLARRMVKLSGLSLKDEGNPDGDIAIEITGLRPGEKLYEELLIGDNPQPTDHSRIMKAHEQFLDWLELQPVLARLSVAAEHDDLATIQQILREHVHGYQPDAATDQSSQF